MKSYHYSCGDVNGQAIGQVEAQATTQAMCVEFAQNVATRILLAQTLLNMKNVRPDILPEFKEKIELLQNEKPLPQPAHGVVQRMFDEVFAV